MWFVLLLLTAAGCCAAAGEPVRRPSLRHVNYAAVRAPRGTRLQGQVACLSHGYADWLRCRLVRPDGFVAAAATVKPGETGTLVVTAEWDGLCAIETNSGWNLAQVALPDDVPHAYRSRLDAPLQTVRAWGPLYFFVPTETRYFNLWLHASVATEGLRYTVRNPNGEITREDEGDFDERTKLQLRVLAGQDGAAWSIEISAPKAKGIHLDDVSVELGRMLPPFLAPKREWAKLFAADWRPEPDAPRPRTRLEPTEPALKPFVGLKGPEVEQAYARDTADGWRTSLPFTYVLDYGPDHLGNDAYVPTVGTAPPVLLHLGKDVPFNHGWGPIRALGGENQAYGTYPHITLLSPDEVSARIAGLRQMVEALHRAGVRWITPYVCGMTLNGDPEKRTGFWAFYDRWDAYRPLGLAARPEADPFQWLQRLPDGRPRQYYRYSYPDEYYPPFKANHRFAACWRSEGWRTWLCEVVRFVARCGCDGVFVDNANSQRCQCPRCLDAFRRRLRERFPFERRRQLFGDIDLARLEWPDKAGTPLHAEMQRFWSDTVGEELATLKAVGTKALGRDFLVFPNGGVPACIQRGLRDADFVMFEKSVGDYGTHPGMVLVPVFEGVTLRAWNDSIFEHKFVQCLRRRVRPIILSRAGWPRRQPHQALNAHAARLGMAECGAFSGGGGFLLRPDFGVYHDALNQYRRFFETHPRLFAGLDTHARVAVLACPEQGWLGNRAHLAALRALTDALTEAHVLFDYVVESRLQQATLTRYATAIAPEVRVLSEEQLGALAKFVKGGGRLLVIGDFGTHDEALAERQRGTSSLWLFIQVDPKWPRRWGRGEAVRCADIPAVIAALGNEPSILACPDEAAAPHVKVNAFRAPDDAGPRLLVHVVNYNVPLGVDAPEPEPIRGIELRVPLPRGVGAVTAEAFLPDELRPIPLAPQLRNGRARIPLPPLLIYQVVELRLER